MTNKMTLDEAIEYIKECGDDDKIEEIRDEIEEKKDEIETLSDEISGLESEIEEIYDNMDNDEEYKTANNIIEHYKSEIIRIEDSIKSGLFKNVEAITKQVEEYKGKLRRY
jgi:predicted  nucleic acid-binding Zn-ribbon protein